MVLHLGDGPLIIFADLNDGIWLQSDLIVVPRVVEGLHPTTPPTQHLFSLPDGVGTPRTADFTWPSLLTTAPLAVTSQSAQ